MENDKNIPSTRQMLDFLNDLFGPMGPITMMVDTEENNHVTPHNMEEKMYFTNKNNIVQVDFVNKRRF